MPGTEIEKYVAGDEMPRLMQDVRLLDACPLPDVSAVEYGTRDHPSGVIEEYTRIEFR